MGDAGQMMESEKLKMLIGLLMKCDSGRFVESIVALLDIEEEVKHTIRFVQDNPEVNKADIYEQILKIKK